MKKKSLPPFHVGTCLLFVIFIILCLVTFATLSLSSAQNDITLANRLVERKSEYYNACNKAEDKISEIENTLKNNQNIENLDVDYDTNTHLLSFEEKVNDDQYLEVVLYIETNPTNEYYQIESWKLVSNSGSKETESIQLTSLE